MSQQMNHQWIKDRLPHRWPFLHVDRVTKITDKTIEGYKNVSAADSAFLGHFPQVSILPGVIVVEALAQLSGLFLIGNQEQEMKRQMEEGQERDENVDLYSKIGLLTSIRNFKFIQITEPGDQLYLKSILRGSNGDCYVFAVSAYVDKREVAVGELQIFLQDKEVVT